MTHVRSVVLAFGIVVAVTAPARADDAADARALVEKAVKAQGGQEKLEKFAGHITKFKGKFHGMGQAIDMTGEISSQGNDKFRMEAEVEAGGMKFQFVTVFSGDKGWTKMGDKTLDMDKDQLASSAEQTYVGWVESLTPLKDKKFTLATVGEIKVNDKPALGVKVSCKGHHDVDLYFDKETGLLVKREAQVKNEGSDQEVTEESFPSAYKDVQGTKQAMKFTIKRDGKLYVEGEATEMQLVEKLDASLFAKP